MPGSAGASSRGGFPAKDGAGTGAGVGLQPWSCGGSDGGGAFVCKRGAAYGSDSPRKSNDTISTCSELACDRPYRGGDYGKKCVGNFF